MLSEKEHKRLNILFLAVLALSIAALMKGGFTGYVVYGNYLERDFLKDNISIDSIGTNESIDIMISFNITSNSSETLSEHYPSSWTLVDPAGGIVSVYDENRFKIEWNVSGSGKIAYKIRSPSEERDYSFFAELGELFSAKNISVLDEEGTEDNITEDISLSGAIGMMENISGCNDLLNMNCSADVNLTSNIDASCITAPLCNSGYNKTFYGKGYNITNLDLTCTSDYCALFAKLEPGAHVKNVNLVDAEIDSNSRYAAILAGYSDDSSIENSSVSGNVESTYSGDSYIGGLAGYIKDSNLLNSYARVVVEGDRRIGGITGYSDNSDIVACYSDSNITGDTYAAEISGYNDANSLINNSYSLGNSEGTNNIGGIAGANYGIIDDSYSLSDVDGSGNVGCFVGYNALNGKIYDSYSSGNSNGSANVGGFAGYKDNTATISNVYWNNITGNPGFCYDSPGGGSDAGCTSLLDNESYFYSSSNSPMSGWDFLGIWDVCEDARHPFFAWQDVACEFLEIYDSVDLGNITKSKENAFFYANYTSLIGAIENASCSIYFNDSSDDMLWDNSSLYYYERNFSSKGTYFWNVSCNHTDYQKLDANDTILINSSDPETMLLSPVDDNYSILFDNINISCSVNDTDSDLENISLYTDIGGWSMYESRQANGSYSSETFEVDIGDLLGNNIKDTVFEWNCIAYDSEGNNNLADMNYSFGSWDLGNYENISLNKSGRYMYLLGENISGSYESSVKDSGMDSEWSNAVWDEDVNSSLGNITFEFKSCDDSNCSGESYSLSCSSSCSLSSLSHNRYIQYRASFSSTNSSYSPKLLLNSVSISFSKYSPPQPPSGGGGGGGSSSEEPAEETVEEPAEEPAEETVEEPLTEEEQIEEVEEYIEDSVEVSIPAVPSSEDGEKSDKEEEPAEKSKKPGPGEKASIEFVIENKGDKTLKDVEIQFIGDKTYEQPLPMTYNKIVDSDMAGWSVDEVVVDNDLFEWEIIEPKQVDVPPRSKHNVNFDVNIPLTTKDKLPGKISIKYKGETVYEGNIDVDVAKDKNLLVIPDVDKEKNSADIYMIFRNTLKGRVLEKDNLITGNAVYEGSEKRYNPISFEFAINRPASENYKYSSSIWGLFRSIFKGPRTMAVEKIRDYEVEENGSIILATKYKYKDKFKDNYQIKVKATEGTKVIDEASAPINLKD